MKNNSIKSSYFHPKIPLHGAFVLQIWIEAYQARDPQIEATDKKIATIKTFGLKMHVDSKVKFPGIAIGIDALYN